MGEASKAIPLREEHARRLAWFNEYTARLNARPRDVPTRSPCSGSKMFPRADRTRDRQGR
jgi:hypothetical protein